MHSQIVRAEVVMFSVIYPATAMHNDYKQLWGKLEKKPKFIKHCTIHFVGIAIHLCHMHVTHILVFIRNLILSKGILTRFRMFWWSPLFRFSDHLVKSTVGAL